MLQLEKTSTDKQLILFSGCRFTSFWEYTDNYRSLSDGASIKHLL